jgi:dolichol-phosphate mannosyltransferase
MKQQHDSAKTHRSEDASNIPEGAVETIGKVSVILPTYNEKENIGPLIDELIQQLAPRDFEIVVVDDDSPDKTWQIVEHKARNDGRIRLLRRMDKRGLTSALNDGISAARGEIIAWMDCDFQMPPEKLPELVMAVERGCDAAVGSRFVPGGKDVRYDKYLRHPKIVEVHRLLSHLICLMTSAAFLTSHKDWTSGFIAIKREIFDHIRLRGGYGEYFMYLIHYLLKTGHQVVEIPYTLNPRREGVSKTSENYLGLFAKGTHYLVAVLWLALFIKYDGVSTREPLRETLTEDV